MIDICIFGTKDVPLKKIKKMSTQTLTFQVFGTDLTRMVQDFVKENSYLLAYEICKGAPEDYKIAILKGEKIFVGQNEDLFISDNPENFDFDPRYKLYQWHYRIHSDCQITNSWLEVEPENINEYIQEDIEKYLSYLINKDNNYFENIRFYYTKILTRTCFCPTNKKSLHFWCKRCTFEERNEN